MKLISRILAFFKADSPAQATVSGNDKLAWSALRSSCLKVNEAYALQVLSGAIVGGQEVFLGKARMVVTFCPNCLSQLIVMDSGPELDWGIVWSHFQWQKEVKAPGGAVG